MSTTTNFKRIALVAVAALGLGVLSSVPSQATISSLNVTVTNGSSGVTGAKSDSTTAGNILISGLFEVGDSVTVTLVESSIPSGATSRVTMMNMDSSTSTLTNVVVETLTAQASTSAGAPSAAGASLALGAVTSPSANGSAAVRITKTTAAANITWNIGVQMDSATSTRVSGTYSWSVVVKRYDAGSALLPVETINKTISLTVAALASESAIASSATSTAFMTLGNTPDTATKSDSTVAIVNTATGTSGAVVRVALQNAAGGNSKIADSLTVTIDKGSVGTQNNAALGKNVIINYPAGTTSQNIFIFADGSAGTATLSIATKNAGTFTKSITFFGDGASATATLVSSVIGASGTGAVLGTEADSLKNNLGGGTSLFAYSSDTSVISNYGTACGTYDSTIGGVLCDLTGVKSGTANITLRDAKTVALSTFVSNAVAVRVSIGEVATSAKITFNKTSYAPGEKATAIVTVLDAAGKSMPAGDYSNVFAAGGITTSSQLTWAAGETLTAVNVKTAGNTTASATAPVVSTEPIAQFTYFLPTTGGDVVFTAKGGTGLAVAGQVAITGTAKVVDSGAAALAAVTALATTVASLRTLIVTLTNLVLKIQKKVKA